MKGVRADIRLYELGLVKSREMARSLIMAGNVFRGEVRIEKAGETVDSGAVLTVRADAVPYVSRGGLKLEKALEVFPISVKNKVAADLGASTGGFTDCMLQRGAVHVYAVDVGYGQLDWKLRNDERVTVMERTNARNVSVDWFALPVEFATLDLSFISSKLILLPLFDALVDGAELVVLVKPQFEAGRGKVGKNGVVRDALVHAEAIASTAHAAIEMGYSFVGLDFSPVTGPKGNIEFLLCLKKDSDSQSAGLSDELIAQVVSAAHEKLI